LTAIVQRTEINRTLETGQRRLALSRAHVLFTLTEQIFAVAKGLTDLSLAEEEVAPLIRRLHEESPWSGATLQSVLADLHNANPALPRDWIDAMMGHAVDEGESEGRKTYTAGYTTENIQFVVNALAYPIMLILF
jgi:hypothetical protein